MTAQLSLEGIAEDTSSVAEKEALMFLRQSEYAQDMHVRAAAIRGGEAGESIARAFIEAIATERDVALALATSFAKRGSVKDGVAKVQTRTKTKNGPQSFGNDNDNDNSSGKGVSASAAAVMEDVSEEEEVSTLPPNWEVIPANDGTGDVYYWNAKTNDTSWDRPRLDAEEKEEAGRGKVGGGEAFDGTVAGRGLDNIRVRVQAGKNGECHVQVQTGAAHTLAAFNSNDRGYDDNDGGRNASESMFNCILGVPREGRGGGVGEQEEETGADDGGAGRGAGRKLPLSSSSAMDLNRFRVRMKKHVDTVSYRFYN